jgi:phage gp16-like protein
MQNQTAPLSVAQKKWIKVLHIAKKQCGLDDDAYRAVLGGAAGVESSRDITTWRQYNDVMAAFKNLGFHIGGRGEKGLKKPNDDYGGKRNPLWISERQEYYIRGLWDLASRKKDAASLRAMIKRIAGVDDIRFCLRTDAQKVILALRAITDKAGYDPDHPVYEQG